MPYEVVRSEEEIDDVLNDCVEAEDAGSCYPGMTYEQGILYAIRWLIGQDETRPLDE